MAGAAAVWGMNNFVRTLVKVKQDIYILEEPFLKQCHIKFDYYCTIKLIEGIK